MAETGDQRQQVQAGDAPSVADGDGPVWVPDEQAALARIEGLPEGGLPAVLAHVHATIAALPDTVHALALRDGYEALRNAAQVMKRHDIEVAAGRAVCEVDQVIVRWNRPHPPGRPRKSDGAAENPAGGAGFSDPGRQAPAGVLSDRTLRRLRAAHPEPDDDTPMRARLDRIQARGEVPSQARLAREVVSERVGSGATAAAAENPAGGAGFSDGAPPRPMPALRCAGPVELAETVAGGSIDVVACRAPRGRDEQYAVFNCAEDTLRPGGLVLVRCAPADLYAVLDRALADYDDGTRSALEYLDTLSVVRGRRWYPVLVLSRSGAASKQARRSAYVAASDTDAWRAVLADWMHPAGGMVCDPWCADPAVVAAADAARLRVVGGHPEPARVEAVRAAVERARSAPGE